MQEFANNFLSRIGIRVPLGIKYQQRKFKSILVQGKN